MLSELSPDEEPAPRTEPDWMLVTVAAPPEVGAAVLELLRNRFGYMDIDWCVLERHQDYSRVDFDPCPARSRADYGYTIDFRDQPGSGPETPDVQSS